HTVTAPTRRLCNVAPSLCAAPHPEHGQRLVIGLNRIDLLLELRNRTRLRMLQSRAVNLPPRKPPLTLAACGRQQPIKIDPADPRLTFADVQSMSMGLSCLRGPVLQSSRVRDSHGRPLGDGTPGRRGVAVRVEAGWITLLLDSY